MQRKEVEVLAKLERNRTRMFGVGDTGEEGEGEGERGAYDGGYDERKNDLPLGAALLEPTAGADTGGGAADATTGDRNNRDEEIRVKREKREKRVSAIGGNSMEDTDEGREGEGEREGNKEERRESRRRKKGIFSHSNPFVCIDPRAVLMEVEDEEDLLGLGEGVIGGEGGEGERRGWSGGGLGLGGGGGDKDRDRDRDIDSNSNSSRGSVGDYSRVREEKVYKERGGDEGSVALSNVTARYGKKRKLAAKEKADGREGSGMSAKAIRAQAGFDRALNRGRIGDRDGERGEVMIDLATGSKIISEGGEGKEKGKEEEEEEEEGEEEEEEGEEEMDFGESTSGVVGKSGHTVPLPSTAPATVPAFVPVSVIQSGELTDQRCMDFALWSFCPLSPLPHLLSSECDYSTVAPIMFMCIISVFVISVYT
jgi:hypothetical protein